MRIVFFGSPQFAATILSDLLKQQVEVVAVVTMPEKPKGRSGTPLPTPVAELASSHQPPIPVLQPEKASAPEVAALLAAYQADLFVVVAYGQILRQNILDIPKLGCINIHGSLLPKYRGAAPIQRCLIEGEAETGVTIMKMVRQMDAGDMIDSARTSIGPNTTFGELEQTLCEMGSQALLRVIQNLKQGPIVATPQNHAEATFAAKITPQDCEIKWHRSAKELHNLVRGVSPRPGAWCMIALRGENKRLKILSSRMEEKGEGSPGELLVCGPEGLVVACGQQALRILEVQVEGKKAMNSAEFSRGISRDSLSFLII